MFLFTHVLFQLPELSKIITLEKHLEFSQLLTNLSHKLILNIISMVTIIFVYIYIILQI
jgi:hypothetical protein